MKLANQNEFQVGFSELYTECELMEPIALTVYCNYTGDFIDLEVMNVLKQI